MFFLAHAFGVADRFAFAEFDRSPGLPPDQEADAEEVAELQQYRRGNRLQSGYDERTRHAICHDREDDERDENARENAWRTHDCHL